MLVNSLLVYRVTWRFASPPFLQGQNEEPPDLAAISRLIRLPSGRCVFSLQRPSHTSDFLRGYTLRNCRSRVFSSNRHSLFVLLGQVTSGGSFRVTDISMPLNTDGMTASKES